MEVSNNKKFCFFCGDQAGTKCVKCNDIWFCCPSHGRLHIREENGICFPWRVEEKVGVGRFMVTTRKVLAGETLFMEEPIVYGPNQESSPICLSCYSSIDLEFLCPGCGYPMCDQECADNAQHKGECEVLSRGNPPVFLDNKTEGYHCILPLRMVLLASRDSEQFHLADKLMDHDEERRGSVDWITTERTVVNNLVNICDGGSREHMTTEEVRRAVGVLEVNSYEIMGSKDWGMRGCFPTASLLSHSCVANSCHIWTTSIPFTNTCIATVDIAPGTEVVTSYHLPATCGLLRRDKLQAGWYFKCSCARCRSPSELSTNHNTLVCTSCDFPCLLPTDPLTIGKIWTCSRCGHTEEERDLKIKVEDLLRMSRDIITTDRYNVDQWLALEDEALKHVHPQHEVILEISKWLVPILCRSSNKKTKEFPLVQVGRKLSLAQRHLDVVNIIDPGYSRARVKTLYEVTETKLFLIFQNLEEKDNSLVIIIVQQAVIDLSDIVRVLERLGPKKGFETFIVGASKNMIAKCDNILKNLRENNMLDCQWQEGWSLLELYMM